MTEERTLEEIEEALQAPPDIELALEENYPFDGNNLDADQKLRCFLCDGFITPDYEARIMVAALDMLYQWIKHGTVPKDKSVEPPKPSRLRAVPALKE